MFKIKKYNSFNEATNAVRETLIDKEREFIEDLFVRLSDEGYNVELITYYPTHSNSYDKTKRQSDFIDYEIKITDSGEEDVALYAYNDGTSIPNNIETPLERDNRIDKFMNDKIKFIEKFSERNIKFWKILKDKIFPHLYGNGFNVKVISRKESNNLTDHQSRSILIGSNLFDNKFGNFR